MSKSDIKKIGIASLIMMFSVFLSRIIGLFREMVVAHIGGAGGAVDAYQIAFIIPEILNHISAGGFLSVTFIPIFSKYLVQDNEDTGWKVFSIILTVFGSLMLVLIAAGMIFTPKLIGIFAPGLTEPSLKADAVRMARIIMPAQFFFFSGGLFTAVQFAKEKFVIPALAPLIYNIGIISGGVLLGPKLGMEGFAWGVLGGAFIGNFALQYRGARQVGLRYKIKFDFFHPDLKKYILITLPLMLGLTMTFSTEFFIRFFGSFLPRGSIAGLNYGIRIVFILVGLSGQAIGVALYPYLARYGTENRMDEMNRLLNHTLRILSLVIPFSVLLMVLRHEVVLLLFQRGKFDTAATEMTSQVLIYLLVGAYAFSAQTIVTRGYYAIQNTVFPAVFGTLAVLFSIPLYLYGIKLMGVRGVALAISISAFIQVALIYGIWNRYSDNKGAKAVYGFILKMVCLSIPMGIFLEWIKTDMLSIINAATFYGSMIVVIVIGIVFAVILMTLGYLFRIEEIKMVINRLASFCSKKMFS